MIPKLDSALSHYHDKIKEELQKSVKDIPGAGAAGGMGTALLAFLDANLQAGIDVVLDETRFQESERCSNCYYRKVKWMSKRFMVKHP